MPDIKEIAKTANQVLGGIGSLVAGGFMGPAGATGVTMAAGGVDKIIDMAVPGDSPSRAERFERGDFQARTAGQKAKAESTQPTEPERSETAQTENAQPGNKQERIVKAASTATSPPTAPASQTTAAENDSDIASRFLAARGWSAAEVSGALSGPTGQAQVRPVRQATGTRAASVGGKAIPSVDGERQKMVAGAVVEKKSTEPA